jgi:hypothetical protein
MISHRICWTTSSPNPSLILVEEGLSTEQECVIEMVMVEMKTRARKMWDVILQERQVTARVEVTERNKEALCKERDIVCIVKVVC